MASHLEQDHKFSQLHDIKTQTQACHIGRNNQTRIWCGFCAKIVPLEEKSGVEAWDERYSHIIKHYDDEEQHIDKWIEAIEHMAKMDLRRRKASKKKEKKLLRGT
jgi:hypothetical protein